MSVIERIIEILECKGIAQKEVCAILSINSSTFSTWKKRYSNIPTDKVVDIADFLKVPIRYLLTGEGKKEIIELTDQEEELLRIFNSLNMKDKTALLSRAYELEEQNK